MNKYLKEILKQQVGGTHYQKYPIQPVEYALENNLSFCQASVIAYVTRYKDKGGIVDLEKAKQFIDFLIAEAKYEEDKIAGLEDDLIVTSISEHYNYIF